MYLSHLSPEGWICMHVKLCKLGFRLHPLLVRQLIVSFWLRVGLWHGHTNRHWVLHVVISIREAQRRSFHPLVVQHVGVPPPLATTMDVAAAMVHETAGKLIHWPSNRWKMRIKTAQ